MEDSATVIGDKYGMSGALPPSQDKRVQFEKENDEVYDISEPRHYQKETTLPRLQEADKVQDNWSVIPIKMVKGKNSFQARLFLKT